MEQFEKLNVREKEEKWMETLRSVDIIKKSDKH